MQRPMTGWKCMKRDGNVAETVFLQPTDLGNVDSLFLGAAIRGILSFVLIRRSLVFNPCFSSNIFFRLFFARFRGVSLTTFLFQHLSILFFNGLFQVKERNQTILV